MTTRVAIMNDLLAINVKPGKTIQDIVEASGSELLFGCRDLARKTDKQADTEPRSRGAGPLPESKTRQVGAHHQILRRERREARVYRCVQGGPEQLLASGSMLARLALNDYANSLRGAGRRR